MRHAFVRFSVLALLVALSGCGSPEPCDDCVAPDASVAIDGGSSDPDGDVTDAGTDGSVCSATDCPPSTCEAAYAAGTCAANRACTNTDDGPRCELWCADGFESASVYGPCVACPVEGCTTTEVCADGGVIASSCGAAHRECLDRDNGPACGACGAQYVEAPETGFCAPVSACGDMQCGLGELPRPDDDGNNCMCVEAPCESGSALYEDPPGTAEPACRECTDVFCRPESGGIAHYGFTDDLGRCVCMLEEGWYWPTDGSRVPKRCDDDHDGWMAASAWDSWSASGAIADVTQLACRPNFVDRVELRNEYGQARTLHLCRHTNSRALSIELVPCAAPLERYALPMVESDRNDRLSIWVSASQSSNTTLPTYGEGGVGRVPGPRELNSLTKGCVADADYNDDDMPDVAESQPTDPAEQLDDVLGWELWGSFAYFMELHESAFIADNGAFSAGRMIITERSRCDTSAFPLGYSSADAPGVGLPYWRECHRQPDARFDPEGAPGTPGFDFAQWSCSDPGNCEMAPFPYDSNMGDPAGWLSAHGAVTPGQYGLCGSRTMGAPVSWGDGAGASWRGMHHHSQFKCVALVPVLPPNAEPWMQPHASLNASDAIVPGHLDFQTCHVANGYDHESSLPASPAIVCDAMNGPYPQVATVGWASIRYDSMATFTNAALETLRVREVAGCVDESLWSGLCEPLPGAATGPMSIGPDAYPGAIDDFGALLACGATHYTWGVNMSVDAPPERTLVWDEGRWE